MANPHFTATEIERFHGTYTKGDGCWEWAGRTKRKKTGTPKPYGCFNVRGTTWLAHRAAWIIAKGASIHDGLCVCHTCDNYRCVRPDHLFLGTVGDNTRDAARKGRLFVQRPGVVPRGENHVRARLTSANVLEMRELNRQGIGCRQLAKRFGVSERAAWFAIRGVTWKHLQ